MAAWELAAYELLSEPWEWKSSKERPEEHCVGVMERTNTRESIQDKSTEQAQRWQGLGK